MTGGKISVLTEEQVRKIHEDRRTYKVIAIEYGITSMTVSNIKSGRTWKHLKLPPTTRGRAHKSIAKKVISDLNQYVNFIEKQVELTEEKVLALRSHF